MTKENLAAGSEELKIFDEIKKEFPALPGCQKAEFSRTHKPYL
jgi:hypothetical protein